MFGKRFFEIGGFDVLEGKNNAGVLATIKRKKVDTLVQNLRFMDMPGIEIAQAPRKDSQTSHIPMIFVTVSVLGEGVKEAEAISNSIFITQRINTRAFTKEIS